MCQVEDSGEKSNFSRNFTTDEKRIESVERLHVNLVVQVSALCASFNQ